MSIKSKNSTSKTNKIGKKGKRKKLEESEDLDSSEEELDLTKECHPIGHYVHDRAEMINQMFSVIKGNKLRAMLPPVMKDYDLDLLKLLCLDQLLGMSERRIACILDGEILETSSESDVDSKEFYSDEKYDTSSYSTSDGSGESIGDCENELRKKKVRGKKKGKSDDATSVKTLPNEAEVPASEQGKTLLEILELEMRARAIRALLKQNETSYEGVVVGKEVKLSESKENVSKENNEVVDLTTCEDDDFPTSEKKYPQNLDENNEITSEKEVDAHQEGEGNQIQEGLKAKRQQAELELRNKLFKKKCYRTRQQRMENEDDKISVKEESCEMDLPNEDPEEGELSSSDDESGLNSTGKETMKPTPKPLLHTSGNDGPTVSLDAVQTSLTTFDDIGIGAEENIVEAESEPAKDKGLGAESEDETLSNADPITISLPDSSHISEGTSWRDRWLQKDGVQKLVKSSKIYAKVKKRIAEKSQRSKEEVISGNDPKNDLKDYKEIEIIEGSIKEYEKLVGKNVNDLFGNEYGAIAANGNSDSPINNKNALGSDQLLPKESLT